MLPAIRSAIRFERLVRLKILLVRGDPVRRQLMLRGCQIQVAGAFGIPYSSKTWRSTAADTERFFCPADLQTSSLFEVSTAGEAWTVNRTKHVQYVKT
jgi:hypothetical protein